MRLIHAVRDLSAETGTRIETVALYTDADRTATFVREADIAYPLGPASARPYLDHAVLERALVETGADAAWVGWGFVAEDPAFAELCEKIGVTFIGPSAGGDAQARRQDRLEADRRGGRRPGRAVEPRRGRHPRRRAARRRRDRLPADAQGDRRRRRARHPDGRLGRGPDRRLRAHQPGGAARVRLRRGVPGAPGHRRPARRGPGHRRRAGHRVGAGRARLLGAAAQPEGHRGVRLPGPGAGADRRAEGVRRAARRRRRLPRRLHRRVPLPPRREAVRLPRGQHPAAGRAPDHRDHHRHRPGPAAAARGGRRAAGGRRSRSRLGHAVEARLNAEDPDRDFAPVPRPHRPAGAARRARHPRRHRRQRGRHHPGRLRLDDREDHRVRPRPRRGAGPAAPRDGRDHGHHRGRRHQQELRARPARPARGDRRAAPTPAGSTGSAPRAAWSATGTPVSPWPRPRSRPTRTRRPISRHGCWPPRTAGGRRCSTRSAARWSSSCAAPATG